MFFKIFVKGITELVTSSGLVNLDFADIKAVMANGGVSLIGMGESDSTNRAAEAVEKGITIIELSHYDTEKVFLPYLKRDLEKLLKSEIGGGSSKIFISDKRILNYTLIKK